VRCIKKGKAGVGVKSISKAEEAGIVDLKINSGVKVQRFSDIGIRPNIAKNRYSYSKQWIV